MPEAFKPELKVSVPKALDAIHVPAVEMNPGISKPSVPGGVAEVP